MADLIERVTARAGVVTITSPNAIVALTLGDEAAALHEEALAGHRAVGSVRGEINALGDLAEDRVHVRCAEPRTQEPAKPGQSHATRRAAIAAPDRSAFGTKPWAPQSWMQRP